MKKALIIVAASVVFLFIVIQFFQPAKNDNPVNLQDDIAFKLAMPAAIKNKITNACYDCHSNKTAYPFYNNFAPVSWMMARHIHKGKEHLNFSEWATYERKQQVKLLAKICDEIKAHEMPLKSYIIMHRNARISKKELEEICNWTEQASEQVMGQKD